MINAHVPARVLDLGCGRDGAGLSKNEIVVGVDIDLTALKSALKVEGRLVVCARGEQLPFKGAAFSRVGSNVALPYMRIPVAVREISRVLRPGGSVWLSLHPWSMTASELVHAIRAGNVRNTIYRCYILLNGACFHLTGYLFRFPLKRTRCESFQTSGRMTKTLIAAGFGDIHWERFRQFVITARRREPGK